LVKSTSRILNIWGGSNNEGQGHTLDSLTWSYLLKASRFPVFTDTLFLVILPFLSRLLSGILSYLVRQNRLQAVQVLGSCRLAKTYCWYLFLDLWAILWRVNLGRLMATLSLPANWIQHLLLELRGNLFQRHDSPRDRIIGSVVATSVQRKGLRLFT